MSRPQKALMLLNVAVLIMCYLAFAEAYAVIAELGRQVIEGKTTP